MQGSVAGLFIAWHNIKRIKKTHAVLLLLLLSSDTAYNVQGCFPLTQQTINIAPMSANRMLYYILYSVILNTSGDAGETLGMLWSRALLISRLAVSFLYD